MRNHVKGMTALLIGQIALVPSLYAVAQQLAEGQGPANQPPAGVIKNAAGEPRKVFKVGLGAMTATTKQRLPREGEQEAPLPPVHTSIERIEDGEYAGAVKCTVIVHGWPIVKDKEENKAGKLTGKIVKQLSLASTRSGVPVMVEGEDGERERMLFDVEIPNEETGEPETYQFAATTIAHFYGKDVRSVTKRAKNA